jgi:hypothetical protein
MRDTQWGNGTAALILADTGEHFQKNILRQVFLRHAPRQMRTHNPDDQRVKVVHQRARRRLITLANAFKAAGQVKRLGVRHGARNTRTYTARKTPALAAGYIRAMTNPRLDESRRRPLCLLPHLMRIQQQALRLTITHGL